MTVEQEMELLAARDCLARTRNIDVGRTTLKAEIIAQVAKALRDGVCVRKGRLGLATHEGIVRYIASDVDDARNDPELWVTTARVRVTWGLSEPNIIERLSVAFVNAWYSDWSHGAAPVIALG